MALKQKFIVVDDHPVYRHGVAALVKQELHFESVGEASNISEALALMEKEKPNLAIVDISLEGQNGLDLIKIIKTEYSKTNVLVVSMHEEILYGERAIKAGAKGYVMKNSDPSVLLAAVKNVVEGKLAISAELRERFMEMIVGGVTNEDPVKKLSDRELEVFQLIGKGYGVTEIADVLHISVKTVSAYKENIKEKLNIQTAADLRKYAVEWIVSNSS